MHVKSVIISYGTILGNKTLSLNSFINAVVVAGDSKGILEFWMAKVVIGHGGSSSMCGRI